MYSQARVSQLALHMCSVPFWRWSWWWWWLRGERVCHADDDVWKMIKYVFLKRDVVVISLRFLIHVMEMMIRNGLGLSMCVYITWNDVQNGRRNKFYLLLLIYDVNQMCTCAMIFHEKEDFCIDFFKRDFEASIVNMCACVWCTKNRSFKRLCRGIRIIINQSFMPIILLARTQ